MRGLSSRVTPTFAETSSTTPVEPGGTKGLLAQRDGSAQLPTTRRADLRTKVQQQSPGWSSARPSRLWGTSAAPSRTPNLTVSVVGLNLRPLVEAIARIVSSLLDEASTTGLLSGWISERSGRIRPVRRGAAGSEAGAPTFLISAAVGERCSSPNAVSTGFVWTRPRFVPTGARFCCRRISTVNEGGARFKRSPQYSVPDVRRGFNGHEEFSRCSTR